MVQRKWFMVFKDYKVVKINTVYIWLHNRAWHKLLKWHIHCAIFMIFLCKICNNKQVEAWTKWLNFCRLFFVLEILTLRNSFQWKCTRNTNIFNHENAFENVVCKMCAILFRPQLLNTHWWTLYWEIRMQCNSSNFQINFSNWWLRYLLWSCPHMNITGPF